MIESFYKNRLFILFSIIFLSLMIGNYTLNRSFAKEILMNEQLSILKSWGDRIEKWIENKKSNLEAINSLIQNYDSQTEGKTVQDILEKSEEIANFSSVYAGYETGVTISSKPFNKPANYDPTARPWYINTVAQDKIYITKPYVDMGLKIPVISICQSIKQGVNLKGVICGILSFDDIKNEIKSLKFENDGFIFLMDENFNVLLHPDDKFELKKADFKYANLDITKTTNYETTDEILTLKPLKNSKLILVAKTLKKNIYTRINKQFIVNFTIYIISIFLFLILAFFITKKTDRQNELLEQTKREYEMMLFSQAKMAELGQMIAAISHQWIQPLNSLGIFLGNLVQFKKLGKMSDEIFYDNIQRSLQNIDYMASTMNTFKNFYKLETKTQIFDVKQAVLDTIFILFSKSSSINIKVIVKKGGEYTCQNYINEFKQIIACLIQNSKQALQESKNKKRARIVVSIKQSNTHFEIRIIDNGAGIDGKYQDKIFTPFSSTKGSSGLGLYISKLIACKKLGGDLELIRHKNPTIFMLKISKKVL